MIDLFGAMRRPFSNEKRFLLTFLIGLLTPVPGVNVVSTVVLYGYAGQVGKMSLSGKKGLPDWKNIKKITIYGLAIAVIDIIYALPFVLAAIATGGLALAGTITGIIALSQGLDVEAFIGVVGSAAAFGILFTLALAILTAYLVPLAVMNYIKKGKFRSAFDFSTILKKGANYYYLAAWLFTVLYAGLLGVFATVLAALAAIPLLSFAIFSAWIAISIITTFSVYGEIYSKL